MSGYIISIIDSSEGLGQSLISSSLAMTLANQSKKEIGLLNLNFNAPSYFSFLFNVKTQKSLNDIFEIIERLDAKMFRGFLAKHPSGVCFTDTVSGFDSTKVLISRIELLLSFLRETFDFSVVSVNRYLSPQTISVLDGSNIVILVIPPHLLSVKNASDVIQQLKTLHFPLSFVKILINMSGMKGALDEDIIKEHLKADIIGRIPYDSGVIVPCINEGTPPLERFPHSPFSKAIKEIGNLLLKEKQKSEKGEPSIFQFISSKERKTELKAQELKEEKETQPEDKEKELKKKIHRRLLEEFDLKSFDLKIGMDPKKFEGIKRKTKEIIENIISEESADIPREKRTEIVNDLIDEVLGLGPLEKFLRDESVSEIMVNGPNDIYVEKNGKIYLTDAKFTSEEQLMTVIDRILAPIGRRVDESSPLVDARLQDGSRVNVIIPPLSLIGPTITIRKFVTRRLGIDDLVRLASITPDMVKFLEGCVKLRKNILISGGTGSGKTTLLNMVSSFIPSDERIVTIEDSAELRLKQRHVITLESKPPNIEGKGAIPIRRLVINALRMRPDRIIVGECRGAEALDMLQAMNTGHDGSLTTIHANSPKDAISRLTTMVIMAGTELPQKAILEQIASAINIIVQTARLSDGSRKIVKVTEVLGLDGDRINMQDLFYFEQKGLDEKRKVVGEFKKCGVLPSFFNEFEIHGIEMPESIFREGK